MIRSVEGPLAEIGDGRPGEITYPGAASLLAEVWVAVRASLRLVLEEVTLADLAAGKLPPTVDKLTRDPDAWQPHSTYAPRQATPALGHMPALGHPCARPPWPVRPGRAPAAAGPA